MNSFLGVSQHIVDGGRGLHHHPVVHGHGHAEAVALAGLVQVPQVLALLGHVGQEALQSGTLKYDKSGPLFLFKIYLSITDLLTWKFMVILKIFPCLFLNKRHKMEQKYLL